MKLCINCKHYVLHPNAPSNPELGLCELLPAKQNPVDGSYKSGQKILFCEGHRAYGCGIDAIFYEEKESNHV